QPGDAQRRRADAGAQRIARREERDRADLGRSKTRPGLSCPVRRSVMRMRHELARDLVLDAPQPDAEAQDEIAREGGIAAHALEEIPGAQDLDFAVAGGP